MRRAKPAVRRAAADDDAVIRTRRLTKRYGTLTAVDNLDLVVHRGEIFGLLGQNGAGKTTTILMLLGLTEPTSGEARVMGLDPEREPRLVKRRVGYLPDAVGFYGGLTGRQNLRYTANLNGLRKAAAESAMVDVLEQVGLTDRADDKVETYSRGMRQRLGIADALVKSPDLLILDEPTTAIDPLGVVEILDLLRRLVDERGLAIMLSSHLLTQVQSVCDRIGDLRRRPAGRAGDGRRAGDRVRRRHGHDRGGSRARRRPTTSAGRRSVFRGPVRRHRRHQPAPQSGIRGSVVVRPAGGRRRGAPGDPGRRRRAPPSADHAPPGRPFARRHLPGGGHEDGGVNAADTAVAEPAAVETPVRGSRAIRCPAPAGAWSRPRSSATTC